MTNFVLVHGAWYGSWSWKRLRGVLQKQGHNVFTPTLTGVGERSHLLSPEITLETHINDVANLILFEDIDDIVLVGHSYGGFVVGHVADRLSERIRALIYIDAFVPDHGKALVDYLPRGRDSIAQLLVEDCPWKIRPIPAAAFNVLPEDLDWINQQVTLHPFATFEAPAKLEGHGHKLANIGYIFAQNHKGHFGPTYEAAKARGWWHHDFAGGHNIMLDDPEGLAKVLVERTAFSLAAA